MREIEGASSYDSDARVGDEESVPAVHLPFAQRDVTLRRHRPFHAAHHRTLKHYVTHLWIQVVLVVMKAWRLRFLNEFSGTKDSFLQKNPFTRCVENTNILDKGIFFAMIFA